MKILINTPAVNLIGGVAQIYKVLQLNKHANIDYFEIITKTSESKISKLFRIFFKYIKFIFKIKDYEIIHLNPSFLKNSFYRDALYCFIAQIFNKSIIVFWHGWEDDFEEEVKKSKFKKWILLNTFGKANITLILGKIFQEKLINLGVKSTKFELITSIADDTQLKKFDIESKFEKIKTKNHIDLLFLSRIVKEKGVYIAIDTIHKINMKYTNKCILHIAGTGEELDNVKDYVGKNKIKNIIFHGFIKGESKYKLLTEADICFFPTYYGEGLPNSILESMLYAQPIISRINAGITDHIINKENGFLTDSINSNDFLELIEYFINDKDEIINIGRINYEKAKKNYTASKVEKKLLSFYSRIDN